MSETIQVPKGWKEIRLEDCISNILGGDWGEKDVEPLPEDYVRVKILRATEMGNWSQQKGKTGVTRIIKKSSLEKRQLAPNDLILEISGGSTNFTVGRCVLIDEEVLEGDLPVICANFFRKIRLKDDVNPSFIHYLLHNFHATKRMTQYISKSTNIQNLKVPQLLSHRFVIPPLSTQKEIVQKLDGVLGQLEEKRIEIISKLEKFDMKKINYVYRNHLLKLAFKGKFTYEWRKSLINKPDLSRIYDEIDIQKKLKSKLKISALHKDEIINIPDGWIGTKLAFITSKIVDGTHFKPNYVNSGIPFLSVKDVKDHKVYFENCKYIAKEDHLKLIKRCNPEIDDVLLVKTGATIGRTAVIETKQDFSLFVSVALLKPLHEIIYPKFLSLFLEFHVNQINKDSFLKGGVIKNYHLEDLRGINIAIPSIEEQKLIVQIIEKKITEWEIHKNQFENIQEQHDLIKQQLSNLQSSILDVAFTGKLVQ